MSLDLTVAPSTVSTPLAGHAALQHVPAAAELPDLEGLPPLRTGLLSLTRGVIRAALAAAWNVRVHALDNVPSTGPVILAANHIGTLDGPLLVAATPRTLALAKSELFSSRVGPFLRAAGQIPVSRDHADLRAVKRCLQVLRDERVLAIFPEGRRGLGDMTDLKGGAAYLAMVTGAPIIPVAILGTRRPRGHLKSTPPLGSAMHIVYGEQVHIPMRTWPRRKADVADATHYLAQVCRDHLDHAQQLTGMSLPGA